MMDTWKVLCVLGDSPLPKGDQRPRAPTYSAPLLEVGVGVAQGKGAWSRDVGALAWQGYSPPALPAWASRTSSEGCGLPAGDSEPWLLLPWARPEASPSSIVLLPFFAFLKENTGMGGDWSTQPRPGPALETDQRAAGEDPPYVPPFPQLYWGTSVPSGCPTPAMTMHPPPWPTHTA